MCCNHFMPVRSHSQIEHYLYVFLFSDGEKFECEIGSHSNLISQIFLFLLLTAENFRVAWSLQLAPGATSVTFHCLVSTFDLSVFLKVLRNPSGSKKKGKTCCPPRKAGSRQSLPAFSTTLRMIGHLVLNVIQNTLDCSSVG